MTLQLREGQLRDHLCTISGSKLSFDEYINNKFDKTTIFPTTQRLLLITFKSSITGA